MTESITQKDLEGLRRVASPAYLATIEDTRAALSAAFNQAAQGWGVGQDVSVILRLASELDAALPLAAEADELGRKCKGLELQLGRVKKRLEKADAHNASQAALMTEDSQRHIDLKRERDELKAKLTRVTAERDDLLNELDDD